jgi:hypothetical protein
LRHSSNRCQRVSSRSFMSYPVCGRVGEYDRSS